MTITRYSIFVPLKEIPTILNNVIVEYNGMNVKLKPTRDKNEGYLVKGKSSREGYEEIVGDFSFLPEGEYRFLGKKYNISTYKRREG